MFDIFSVTLMSAARCCYIGLVGCSIDQRHVADFVERQVEWRKDWCRSVTPVLLVVDSFAVDKVVVARNRLVVGSKVAADIVDSVGSRAVESKAGLVCCSDCRWIDFDIVAVDAMVALHLQRLLFFE